ncbi:MAG: Ldh family oxidoreductase [Anaerolineaceae bacterium]|nr:Ldh family oxidoreductase [Anaerolineaceae bacterium]
MPRVSAEQLTDFSGRLYRATGAPPDIADYVAETLVRANLTGHDSHGVLRHEAYLRQVKGGAIQPAMRPRIKHRYGAIAVIDCRRGYGQVGARYGMAQLRGLAREHGVAAVALTNCNHIGRLGEYAAWLADEGLVGLVMVGCPGTQVVPWGGREPATGTNPMAWGVPTGRGPMVLDFATSIVAAGKLLVYSDRGEPIPEGWVLDSEGQPTRDPDKLFEGGMLLPFGSYKGYGLNLMMALIPVLLAGTLPSGAEGADPAVNPTLMLALSIEHFGELEDFMALADELRENAHRIRPAEGQDLVLLPGEPEERVTRQRQREGIPLPEGTWSMLQGLAQEWGVEPLVADH